MVQEILKAIAFPLILVFRVAFPKWEQTQSPKGKDDPSKLYAGRTEL